jgi:hypothetical protein
MPWCGPWGTVDGSFWWIAPLLCLVFMGLMAVVCFRGFGWLRHQVHGRRELPDLQREIERLKEEVRKLARPSS